MRWSKVSIIGVGLLGGSLGLALKRNGLADKVVGWVRRPESVQECLERGVADEVTMDLGEAVRGADLVVLCTSVGSMKALAELLVNDLAPGCLVTDVGSVKAGLVEELEAVLQGANRGVTFVGSHPMAGSHEHGVVAARAELFDGAVCVVTTSGTTAPDVLQRVSDFWSSVGGLPTVMTPQEHDWCVGFASHLPHIVAVCLVNVVLGGASPNPGKLCATGFRDTTRIASGLPGLWRDIIAGNSENIQQSLDLMIEELSRFRENLKDPQWTEACFDRARVLRNEWMKSDRFTSFDK